MGITHGVTYATVRGEQCTKCIPDVLYKKFPPAECKAPGKMIVEIEALHKACYMRPRPEGAYWWTDVQFTPHDDSCLYVTCAAFAPRSDTAWISHSQIPRGKVMRVYLHDEKKPTGIIFKGSSMPNYPKLQTHPSGRYIGYIGSDSVKITTQNHEDVYNKSKDLRNCNHRFCAFSPDGRHLAILQSHCRRFELVISSTNKPTAFNDDAIDLSSLMSGFKGERYNEHIECKWSPDSQFIAICTSIKFLFIVNIKLELVVDVTDEILPEAVFPSWSSTFDYDPRYHHELLAAGTNDRCLYVVNTVKRSVVLQTEPLSKDALDCVLYSPSGEQIAVSLRNFKVLLLDSWTGSTTFSIDIIEQCPAVENRSLSFPSVMRLCFSSKGEHLATATCDGKVRVWQLPTELSLFNMCKWEIFRQVPASKLKLLPLPEKIKNMLVPLPVSKEPFKYMI